MLLVPVGLLVPSCGRVGFDATAVSDGVDGAFDARSDAPAPDGAPGSSDAASGSSDAAPGSSDAAPDAPPQVPGSVEYAATVAECLNPAAPDPVACELRA